MERPQGLALVERAHEFYDGIMKKAVAETYRNGYFVACGRGCFACCFEPAHVTRQEAELLVERLQAMPPEEKERVRAAAAEWMDRFRAAGLEKLSDPDVFSYRAARLACPFLRNGECSVYSARPIACRGHVAIGDREECQDDARRKNQRFIFVNEGVAYAYAMVAQEEPIVFDHLGVWLAELLLGRQEPSACRRGLMVEGGPEAGPESLGAPKNEGGAR